MDWNNCGCVVPHSRKASEWTAAANLNFGTALECALNEGRQRMTGELVGLPEKPAVEFSSYEEVEEAYFRQLANIIRHTAIATVEAQRLHEEMVPRPFLSALHEHCPHFREGSGPGRRPLQCGAGDDGNRTGLRL